MTNIKKMRHIVAKGLVNLGIPDIYHRFRYRILGKDILILMYHRVSPEKGESLLIPLPPDIFEEQMKVISKKYKVVFLRELPALLKDKSKSNEKILILTFDDGYKDNYVYAYPILKKYNIPATIFISSSYINNQKNFWWDQIYQIIKNLRIKKLTLNGIISCPLKTEADKECCAFSLVEKLKKLPLAETTSLIEQLIKKYELRLDENTNVMLWEDINKMDENIVDIGAHTVNHTMLSILNPKMIEYEIIQSKKDIENNTSREAITFSYPYGTSESFNKEVINVVKQNGFCCAVTGIPTPIRKNSNLFTLGRINGNIQDLYKYNISISGLFWDFRHLYGKTRN